MKQKCVTILAVNELQTKKLIVKQIFDQIKKKLMIKKNGLFTYINSFLYHLQSAYVTFIINTSYYLQCHDYWASPPSEEDCVL